MQQQENFRYLANSEEVISKNLFFCLYTQLLLLRLEATDSWALNNDRSYVNAVVFLELKGAFDTVDHEILLRVVKSERQPLT